MVGGGLVQVAWQQGLLGVVAPLRSVVEAFVSSLLMPVQCSSPSSHCCQTTISSWWNIEDLFRLSWSLLISWLPLPWVRSTSAATERVGQASIPEAAARDVDQAEQDKTSGGDQANEDRHKRELGCDDQLPIIPLRLSLIPDVFLVFEVTRTGWPGLDKHTRLF